MKLFIVRHGESPFGNQSDHQRVLSSKGQQQAQKSALFITSLLSKDPTLIVASDAQRTKDTALAINQHVNQADIIFDHRFYGARVGDCCDAILDHQQIPQLILVGHNPTVSMLCHHLQGKNHYHFSPACVAYFELEIATDGLKLPASLQAFFSPDAI